MAVLLTGEQHGYLEPCGCSVTQSGGLGRRADLFRKLREREWPLCALDLGGTLRRARLQSQFKFQTLLAALSELGYQALALGPEELRLGADFLLSAQPPDPDRGPSFLAANVVLYQTPDLGTPLPAKLVTAGELRIGVTAILSPSLAEDVLSGGAEQNITVGDPATALKTVLESWKEQSLDLRVLLSHAELDESRSLAQQFPQFDVVVSAGGPEDPLGEAEMIGRTMLVTVGKKGKYVGVVGFYPERDERLRFELVDLDNRRFVEDPSMRKHMQYYQELLKTNRERVFADLPQTPHPSGSTFVGAAVCAECHRHAHSKWETTHHRQAYESLIRGREGQERTWIPRQHDPECLCCHVTGWNPQEVYRYESGFTDEVQDPHLRGQQCENCHGPASRHVELERLWKDPAKRDSDLLPRRDAELARLRLDIRTARQRVCYRCHDLDNSPDFNEKFDKCWEEVRHPWRD